MNTAICFTGFWNGNFKRMWINLVLQPRKELRTQQSKFKRPFCVEVCVTKMSAEMWKVGTSDLSIQNIIQAVAQLLFTAFSPTVRAKEEKAMKKMELVKENSISDLKTSEKLPGWASVGEHVPRPAGTWCTWMGWYPRWSLSQRRRGGGNGGKGLERMGLVKGKGRGMWLKYKVN